MLDGRQKRIEFPEQQAMFECLEVMQQVVHKGENIDSRTIIRVLHVSLT